MKMNNTEIRELIREGLTKVRESRVAAISAQEAEELLRVYFRKNGGVPEDVTKLSVLFPIMEKIGLDDIVEVYIEKAKGENPMAAKEVMRPVKQALISILQNPMGDPNTSKDDVEVNG